VFATRQQLMNIPAIEIVAIGNELLLGETVEANSAWIARRLAEEGIVVSQVSVVGDDGHAIRRALAAALQRTGTIICTGGLGPTADDLTRHAVAALFGRKIEIDEGWVDTLRERYRHRGLDMPEINRVQAELPEGARLLPNARGTAPGIVLDDASLGTVILLPGVPSEMRGLMQDHVVGLLRARLLPTAVISSRILRTVGLSEATLAERTADIAAATGPVTLAFLPQVAGVDLRLTARISQDPTDPNAAALDELARRLTERVGDSVFGEGTADLAAVVGTLLRDRGLTVSLAESCTGGLLAKRLTDESGASEYLKAAFVTYANAAKRDLIGVQPETLAMHGAVSEQCAREMAAGARLAARAGVGVAVTGIAGPGGGSPDKPVGTVWIGVAFPGSIHTQKHVFPGDRSEIRERSAQAALDLLRRLLLAQGLND
jgi:nicotinamide-nucleotide amidase